MSKVKNKMFWRGNSRLCDERLDNKHTLFSQADGDEFAPAVVTFQFACVTLKQVSLRHVSEDQRGRQFDLSRVRFTARATMRPVVETTAAQVLECLLVHLVEFWKIDKLSSDGTKASSVSQNRSSSSEFVPALQSTTTVEPAKKQS